MLDTAKTWPAYDNNRHVPYHIFLDGCECRKRFMNEKVNEGRMNSQYNLSFFHFAQRGKNIIIIISYIYVMCTWDGRLPCRLSGHLSVCVCVFGWRTAGPERDRERDGVGASVCPVLGLMCALRVCSIGRYVPIIN